MLQSTFKATWDRPLTKENIFSVFTKSGIWTYKPLVVLLVIAPLRPKSPPKASPNDISTFYTLKRIQQFVKTHNKNPTKEAFRKLTKANETNAPRASLTEHRA